MTAAALFDQVRDVVLKDAPITDELRVGLGTLRDDDRGQAAANRAIYQVMRTPPGTRFHLRKLWRLGEAGGPTGPVAEFVSYVSFARGVQAHSRTSGIDLLSVEELAGQAGELRSILAETEALFPGTGSNLLHRSKIESLTDRQAATATLGQARALSPRFFRRLRFDEGAHTYLPSAEVAAEPPAYAMEAALPSLRAGLAARAERFASPKANLLWSMNPRFLRAHGPQWFDLAAALIASYGLGMIVLMVGEPDEVAPLVEEARDLIARTARFHGAAAPEDIARSVVFATLPLPAYVAAPVTFYACARYLHARQVIAETGVPAVVLDADFTPKHPFDSMLAFAGQGDVAFPVSRGLAGLSPWRRYIAMTGYFNVTPGAARFLELTERYLLHGLGRPSSWMLDQNALDHAATTLKGEVAFRNLNLTTRPGGQDPIRKANEHPV
ncbi:MAG TPA: hypothetical protein VEA15_05405 [Caulobacteraceae bacterium]|nr:hypothetical protein [Caulobacteraceae bacterium]